MPTLLGRQGERWERIYDVAAGAFYDGAPPHTGTLNIFNGGAGWQFSFNGLAGQASGRVAQLPPGQTAAR